MADGAIGQAPVCRERNDSDKIEPIGAREGECRIIVRHCGKRLVEDPDFAYERGAGIGRQRNNGIGDDPGSTGSLGDTGKGVATSRRCRGRIGEGIAYTLSLHDALPI